MARPPGPIAAAAASSTRPVPQATSSTAMPGRNAASSTSLAANVGWYLREHSTHHEDGGMACFGIVKDCIWLRVRFAKLPGCPLCRASDGGKCIGKLHVRVSAVSSSAESALTHT